MPAERGGGASHGKGGQRLDQREPQRMHAQQTFDLNQAQGIDQSERLCYY